MTFAASNPYADVSVQLASSSASRRLFMRLFLSLHDCCKECVGIVHVRQKFKIIAALEFDMALGQHLATIEPLEARMSRKKGFDNLAVLLSQHAASRVDQTAAGFEQHCGCIQDRTLLCREFIYRLRRLPPFQIRIAPQCAKSAARRVNQYPVDLACQALDLYVPFTGDHLWMYIGKAGALEPGGEIP